MSAINPSGPNADQIKFWNTDVGEKWAKHQERMDATLAPASARVLDAAALAAGERVLDIGCGCGDTTFAAAKRVGPKGGAVGVDISAPMLARAREIGSGTGAEFVLADASTYAFTAGSFDVALSRFGVMFFAEPVGAFANIRTAIKRNGRLAFVCWQPPQANAWVTVPLEAALTRLPRPAPPDPLAPGPFAFADPARVKAILDDAGFSSVTVEPFAFEMALAPSGNDALDEAVAFAAEMGPTSRALQDAPEEARPGALAAIREALAPHVTASGLRLGANVWIVGARA